MRRKTVDEFYCRDYGSGYVSEKRNYREYPTLELAVEASTCAWGLLPIFARDKNESGSKVFAVMPYIHMLDLAKQEKSRSYYEVLVVSRNGHGGCTDAYFDLEYPRSARHNFGPSDELLAEQVEADVLAYIARAKMEGKLFWAFASNEKKFSAHLRVKLKDCAFSSTTAVQKFFKGLFGREKYAFQTADGEIRDLFDGSVYSRNRLMRVLYATKLNQNRPLLPPSAWFWSKRRESRERGEKCGWILDSFAFLDMLLQREPVIAEHIIDLEHCDLDFAMRNFLRGDAMPTEIPAAHALMPTGLGRSHSISEFADRSTSVDFTPKMSRALKALKEDIACSYVEWNEAILNFTGMICNRTEPGEDAGRFHVWLFFYCSSRSWCLRRGRAHRSNHTRFRVMVEPNFGWFQQGCFDREPPCSLKWSNAFALPQALEYTDAWLAELELKETQKEKEKQVEEIEVEEEEEEEDEEEEKRTSTTRVEAPVEGKSLKGLYGVKHPDIIYHEVFF